MASNSPNDVLTLEDIAQDSKQAKELLNWTPGADLTSIRVGFHKREVEFVASCMRLHSKYFFALSVPTIAYAPQFMDGTTRLMTLDKEEVKMLQWIIDWCHEGGVLNEHQVYQRYPQASPDTWVGIWCLADVLGFEMLQQHMEKLLLLLLPQDIRPSFGGINYFWNYSPYINQDVATRLWNAFIDHYAARTNTTLDHDPKKFQTTFVSHVRQWRKYKNYPKPGEITAFTKPEALNSKAKEREDIGSKVQKSVALRTIRGTNQDRDGGEGTDDQEDNKDEPLPINEPESCSGPQSTETPVDTQGEHLSISVPGESQSQDDRVDMEIQKPNGDSDVDKQ